MLSLSCHMNQRDSEPSCNHTRLSRLRDEIPSEFDTGSNVLNLSRDGCSLLGFTRRCAASGIRPDLNIAHDSTKNGAIAPFGSSGLFIFSREMKLSSVRDRSFSHGGDMMGCCAD